MLEPEPRPWYQRLWASLPPMSDRTFALLFLLSVFLLGACVGMVLCMAGHTR